MDYNYLMVDVVQSETFANWLGKLKDRQTVARINARIRRLSETGNFGDTKVLREGISEMRIDHGPGYRLYFALRNSFLVILLAGGDKGTQTADIKRAIAILKDWKG